MGSRTTHDKRLERLRRGRRRPTAELDRLMSPIGLDIGARTPEETAISICAEIIAPAPADRSRPSASATADGRRSTR